MTVSELKICSRCKEIKGIDQFFASIKSSDGKVGHCKQCARLYESTYRKRKTEVQKNRRNALSLEKKRELYERRKDYRKKYYMANSERLIATSLKHYYDNKQKFIEKMSDAGTLAAYREMRRVNRMNRSARESGGKLSKNIAYRLFELQRGKCACCGKPLGEDFHLDHIQPLSKGGVNEDWNIQLLREKCNLKKGSKDPVQFMQERGFLL